MSDDTNTKNQTEDEINTTETQIQPQPIEIESGLEEDQTEDKKDASTQTEEVAVVEEQVESESELSPEEQKKIEEELTNKKAQEELAKMRETFRPGDTIKVYTTVKEGDKERIQAYQGIVISKKGRDISKTFTVRKIAVGGVGVERIWPLYSPAIVKIDIIQKGKVRKAKLYYMRDRIGKAAMAVKKRQ